MLLDRSDGMQVQAANIVFTLTYIPLLHHLFL